MLLTGKSRRVSFKSEVLSETRISRLRIMGLKASGTRRLNHQTEPCRTKWGGKRGIEFGAPMCPIVVP